MRNYLNNLSDLYAITYFTLSDLSNPIVSLKRPFQDADVLFTFNGLKEASATALSFIGKFGGMTMAFAKNFIVTKEGIKSSISSTTTLITPIFLHKESIMTSARKRELLASRLRPIIFTQSRLQD